MLETYLSSARTGDAELRSVTEAPMPTRAEDVDKFMAELVRACSHHDRHGTTAMTTTAMAPCPRLHTSAAHAHARARHSSPFARRYVGCRVDE